MCSCGLPTFASQQEDKPNICSTRGEDHVGWSEEMMDSPRKRVEEEKVGKETDCRIRGRKITLDQGFVSCFFPVCRLPPGYLALPES